MENDLSGIVSPGDRINVVGVLRSYQQITKFARTCFFVVYLDGNSIEKRKEEFEEIRIRLNPKLTRAARKRFEEFYVGLRSMYDSDNVVPVTARQLEALIRLGEARARTRLSPKVMIDDAERVIDLVNYCLKTVYVDPETGKLDVDWVTVGTTKTQRDRSRTIVEIVQELEKEYGNEVPVKEILDLAEERGIEREKAEKAIDMLKMDGIFFSSSHNVVGFVR